MHLGAPLRAYISGHVDAPQYKQVQATPLPTYPGDVDGPRPIWMHVGAPLPAYISGYVGAHNTPHNTSRFKPVQASSIKYKQVQVKDRGLGVKGRGLDCGVLWATAPLPPPRLLHIHHNKAPCLLSGPRGRRPKAAAPQMRPKVANFAVKLPGADPTNTPTPRQRRGTRPSSP